MHNRCPCADDRPVADLQALAYNSVSANVGSVPYRDLTQQRGSGCNVHVVANHTVMFHHRARIHDHILSDSSTGVDHSSGQYHRASSEQNRR